MSNPEKLICFLLVVISALIGYMIDGFYLSFIAVVGLILIFLKFLNLIIEDGEVFSSEGDFLCFVGDLELFQDFEEKNKCEKCMDTGYIRATIDFNLQESLKECECDKHFKYV